MWEAYTLTSGVEEVCVSSLSIDEDAWSEPVQREHCCFRLQEKGHDSHWKTLAGL